MECNDILQFFNTHIWTASLHFNISPYSILLISNFKTFSESSPPLLWQDNKIIDFPSSVDPESLLSARPFEVLHLSVYLKGMYHYLQCLHIML